jgi:hypothetical protein
MSGNSKRLESVDPAQRSAANWKNRGFNNSVATANVVFENQDGIKELYIC